VTRILYWNIERFSAARIDVANAVAEVALRSEERLGLINQIFAPPAGGALGAPPDIFVIVEVSARTDPVIPEGRCLETASPGGSAVRQLIEGFREDHGANWSLVPPLLLGVGNRRESVAVFYNSTTVEFAGPWVYAAPGGAHPSALPSTVANLEALQEYPAGWTEYLPAGGAPWEWERGGVMYPVPENQCAGQWEYRTAANKRIYFPGWDNRAPFHTLFKDVAGERWVKLFTVHTSPGSASAATKNLARIEELEPEEGGVSVVLGDFNVDPFQGTNRYFPLIEKGFEFTLDPWLPGAGAGAEIVAARKPYCMTHLLPTLRARPWNAVGVGGPDTDHNVYPRFGYMGSTIPGGGLGEAGAIDNALVKYHGPAGEFHTNVVNPIVGTPYNQIPEAELPEGVTEELVEGPAYPVAMANGIPLPGGVAAAGDIPGEFRSWENYGRIRSTSDHLPLMIQV
jgi:hypothetical protein